MRVWPSVLGVVLLAGAVVLGWLAFTQFGQESPPASGSPGFRDYEAARLRDARVSAVLGLASAASLAGAFACYEVARRVSAQP